MTKDFRYKGFSSPNGTVVPDDVFDVLAPELTEAELRVLLYIVRRTFGFKKNTDAISLGQLCNGIKTRDGRVLDRGTGMSRSAVIRGVAGLEAKGVLLKDTRKDEKNENETNVYSLRFIDDAEAETEKQPENEGVVLQKNHPSPLKKLPQSSKETTVVLQRDPQQTDIQETVLQQTVNNTSNVRMSTRSKNDFVDKSISQPISLEESAEQPNGVNGHVYHGMEGLGDVLKRRPGRPRKFESQASKVILDFTADFRREFPDSATLQQSAGRMINLFNRWGRDDIDAFASVLYEARSITKYNRSHINGSVFAYFCSVVEDLLGLKEDHHSANLPN